MCQLWIKIFQCQFCSTFQICKFSNFTDLDGLITVFYQFCLLVNEDVFLLPLLFLCLWGWGWWREEDGQGSCLLYWIITSKLLRPRRFTYFYWFSLWAKQIKLACWASAYLVWEYCIGCTIIFLSWYKLKLLIDLKTVEEFWILRYETVVSKSSIVLTVKSKYMKLFERWNVGWEIICTGRICGWKRWSSIWGKFSFGN